jgi:hypothetical protein
MNAYNFHSLTDAQLSRYRTAHAVTYARKVDVQSRAVLDALLAEIRSRIRSKPEPVRP